MKKIITIAAIAATIATSQAQTSLAWEYNTRSKDWTPLVATKLRTLDGVPLLRSFDVSGIFAVQSGTGAPSLGFMASKTFRIANGVDGLIGVTGRYVQNRPPQFMGLVIGVKF